MTQRTFQDEVIGEGTSTSKNRTSEVPYHLALPFDSLPCGIDRSSWNGNRVPDCTWGTDPVGDVDNSRVVRGRGDTVAGDENRVPKCAVRSDLNEVKSIGLFRGGGRTTARNENRVPECTRGKGLLPRPRSRRVVCLCGISDVEIKGVVGGRDETVFQTLRLTMGIVRDLFGGQRGNNVRSLEPLRVGKTLGNVCRN